MSLNIKEIIDSEKFVGISDFKFSEFCSSENFQKENKHSDVTILEEKNEKNINYVWYISNNFKIKSNSIIFCQADVVEHFFSVLKNYEKLENIILITHQSDRKITKKVFNLKPEFVSKWFATNVCFSHPDLIPIPIGVNNSFYKINPNSEDIIKAISKKNEKKINKAYVNFNINTKQFHRLHTIKMAKSSNFFYHQNEKLNKEDYLIELAKYRYTLCPWGNGFDTHRVWESIYLGSIPIIKYHRAYKHVDNIPLSVVKSFKNLEEKNHELKKHDDKKIFFSYWSKLIKDLKLDKEESSYQYEDISKVNNDFKKFINKRRMFQSIKKRLKTFIFKIYKNVLYL